ncbi:hypothetical protein F7725_022166, partial [Dissostichus mawsoni]
MTSFDHKVTDYYHREKPNHYIASQNEPDCNMSESSHGLQLPRAAAPTGYSSHGLKLPRAEAPTGCSSHGLELPRAAAPTGCSSHGLELPRAGAPTGWSSHGLELPGWSSHGLQLPRAAAPTGYSSHGLQLPRATAPTGWSSHGLQLPRAGAPTGYSSHGLQLPRATAPTAGSHRLQLLQAAAPLGDGCRCGQVSVLSVHVMCPAARVVTQPDTKVLHLLRRESVVVYQSAVDGLSGRLLHLPQLRNEVPESGLRHHVIRGEDPHAVQRGA